MCGEPALVFGVCYDHAKQGPDGQPYDPLEPIQAGDEVIVHTDRDMGAGELAWVLRAGTRGKYTESHGSGMLKLHSPVMIPKLGETTFVFMEASRLWKVPSVPATT